MLCRIEFHIFTPLLVKNCCNFEVLNRGMENIEEEEALVVRVCFDLFLRSMNSICVVVVCSRYYAIFYLLPVYKCLPV